MDLVTLRGLIHVYMHVPCLVAPSADQFFFFACLFHSNIWMFANLCQLYGEVEHPEWGSEKSLSQQSQICKILGQKTKLDLCKWILVECWAFEQEIWFADKASTQVMWPEGFLSSSLSVYRDHQSIEIFTLKNKITQLSDLFISKELGEISSIKKLHFPMLNVPCH